MSSAEEQLKEALDLLGEGIELDYIKWDGTDFEWRWREKVVALLEKSGAEFTEFRGVKSVK